MKRIDFLFLGGLLLICCLFFYKMFLGQVPFPGDLLIDYSPYNTVSFLGYAPGGYPNKAQGPDVISHMYPWKYFGISELKQGRIPFWNPHNFSGANLMQNFQSAVFSPFNLPFFILPFSTGWSIFIFLQPILAVVFMYLFLREISLSRFASFIGSIAFTFSSYMVVWMEYGNITATFLWLPLLLFLVSRFISTRKVRYFAIFVISASFSILCGYIQGAFYIFSVTFLFGLLKIYLQKEKVTKKLIFFYLALFILPLLLTAFQLIPTYTLFKDSTRGAYTISELKVLLQPWYYWVTFFAPDFFGNPASNNVWIPLTYIERVSYAGIPILFFASFALFTIKTSLKRFFAILALFIAFIVTNLPFVAYLYLLPIPVINTTVPTRMLSIFIFAVVVLGAMGVSRWELDKKETKHFMTKFLLGFLGVYLLFWLVVLLGPKISTQLVSGLSVAKHNLIIPTLLAIATVVAFLMGKKYGFIAKTLLTMVVIADLFFFFQKITPFSPSLFLYPTTPITKFLQTHAGINRYWGYGSADIEANFQTVDGTYSPNGLDPLHNQLYGEFLSTSSKGKIAPELSRMDAYLVGGYGIGDLRSNIYRQKIMDADGVKYVLNKMDSPSAIYAPDYNMFSGETYKLIWQDYPWQVYENKSALPRAALFSSIVVAGSDEDAINKFYRTDIHKSLVITGNPKKVTSSATGSARIISYGTQKVEIETNTTGPMYLYLSDSYTSNWQTWVDGKPAPIYKADVTFRAVRVEKGKHIVTFYYSPYYFNLGLEVAAAGAVLFLLSIFGVYKYGKKI